MYWDTKQSSKNLGKQITPGIPFDHNGIKLETYLKKKNSRKCTNSQRLKNTPLNEPLKKSRRKFKKVLKLNEYEKKNITKSLEYNENSYERSP